MITGTLTLNAVALTETCDTVYLLTEEELGVAVTLTYEASLDGGTTWEAVTAGQLNTLAHTGTSLKVRLTLGLPDASQDVGVVRWLVCYGTTSP